MEFNTLITMKFFTIKKKVVFAYSFIWERENNSYLLVCSPNAYNSQDWVRLSFGTRNSAWICHVDIRDPRWAITCCLQDTCNMKSRVAPGRQCSPLICYMVTSNGVLTTVPNAHTFSHLLILWFVNNRKRNEICIDLKLLWPQKKTFCKLPTWSSVPSNTGNTKTSERIESLIARRIST